MVNGLTPNYKLKRYLFSRGINDNRTINATLTEAIKYQRNLDKPVKERETINSNLLDSKTKTWISKNIPNLKNSSNILKIIDRLKPYTSLVRGGSFSIGTNRKSVVFVPNNTDGTEDIHPSMRTYLTDKLFNADNDNRLYVSISKLKNLIQSGAYTKELNELFNQIKSRLPFEISVLTVSNKQEFMVKLNEFVEQYDASVDNKGRKQVLNTLTDEGSIEKLKKNWESVKRIIRKNIPIGKVPTNETVDAIYEDLKQGYKIENLGKLFLEGSDFENQLEEKVSNSSTSKTYGWWIRRVMVRKKGLKSLLEVEEEDREYSLTPELFKMEVSELPEDDRRRIKTFLQDAEPTEFFGEEYLKLTKLINTLGDIVDSSEEGQLEGLDEENLKLIKKLAHLRKRYENLYQDIYGMVYGEEE